MKRMFKISFVFFLFSFSSVFPQNIPVVNGWEYGPDVMTVLDTGRTKSTLYNGYQVFSSYGYTKLNSEWYMQTTWDKDFWISYPVMPDSMAVDVKIFSKTSSVSEAWMIIAVQDSNAYFWGLGKKLDLISGWQTLKFSRKDEKNFGILHFGRLYLVFQLVSKDSSYIGAEIAVSNLRGIDDTLGVVVYDNFTLTAIESKIQIPSEFVLYQNYPNPFNPSTTIKFTIPKREYVNLIVFNILGQEIKTLVNEERNQGSYEVVFNASGLPSGMYLYRLQAGSFVKTKKMILVK